MKCVICHGDIEVGMLTGWSHGNNAQPVMEGRCCDSCDNLVVTPTRIRRMLAASKARLAAAEAAAQAEEAKK